MPVALACPSIVVVMDGRVLVSLDYMPASDSARVTGKIMGNFLRINRAKLQSTPEDACLYKNRGKSNPELLAYLRATFERTSSRCVCGVLAAIFFRKFQTLDSWS